MPETRPPARTHRRGAALVAVGALTAALTTATAAPASAQTLTPATVSGWGTAIFQGVSLNANNFSCRNVARVTLAGASIRIHLSNAFVSQPITFGAVTAGLHTGAGAVPSPVSVTFGGATSVQIPAGGEVTSDSVPLRVTAGADVAVSVYVPGQISAYADHSVGLVTNYCTAFDGTGGNRVTDTTVGSNWPSRGSDVSWLNGIDVAASTDEHAIVPFGDSLTDGVGVAVDSYQRYPDYLSRRLQATAAGSHFSVVNMGIGGNAITGGWPGTSAPERFDRDVLAQRGIRHVILYIGTNDLGGGASTGAVIDGLTQLINRAHAAGVVVTLATLTPRHSGCGQPNNSLDTAIDTVNAWVRSTTIADNKIDFAATVADPSSANCIRPAYDSGDHLHFNAAGYQAMANAFDLRTFTANNGAITAPGNNCVDLPGGNSTTGTRVQLYPCLQNAPQSWTAVNDGTLRAYGKCLDANGTTPTAGSAVQLWDCNGGNNQQWRQGANDSLVNPATGLCVQTVAGATATGTQLQVATCNASATQRFRLPTTAAPTRTGSITAANNRCVDADANGSANGTAAVVATCSTATATWSVVADGTIRRNGKCLDVNGNSTTPGAKIQLWDCNGGGNQQWVQQADGTVLNPQSQACLDIPSSTLAVGTALRLGTCTGGIGQRLTTP